MELRSFISQTLQDVIGGIADAQKETGDGSIVPESAKGEWAPSIGVNNTVNLSQFQNIDFRISIEAQSADKAKGGFGIHVGALAIGAAGEQSGRMENRNEISFSVPVMFHVSTKR